jgi:hypothetical protein
LDGLERRQLERIFVFVIAGFGARQPRVGQFGVPLLVVVTVTVFVELWVNAVVVFVRVGFRARV